MTQATGTPPDSPGGDGTPLLDAPAAPGAEAPAETTGPRLLLHTIFGLALFLALIVALSLFVREEVEAIGRLFSRRLGVAGLALGTYLADALCFPVPPQFYLLTAHLGRVDPRRVLLSVCAASVLAGHSAYHLARGAAALPRLRDLPLLLRARERARPLLRRRVVLAVVLASLSPVPFSWLCYAAGALRMRYGLFCAFTLLRVPRILVYYVLIRIGWG